MRHVATTRTIPLAVVVMFPLDDIPQAIRRIEKMRVVSITAESPHAVTLESALVQIKAMVDDLRGRGAIDLII